MLFPTSAFLVSLWLLPGMCFQHSFLHLLPPFMQNSAPGDMTLLQSHNAPLLRPPMPWIFQYHNPEISLFFSFIFISWRLITLLYSGFCHTLTWISHGFTCVPHPNSPSWSPLPPPSPPDPSGSSQCTSPEHPSHASNLGWWSVLPLIVYLLQCCSLRTSHPRLLPQSPKVCSVHLSLFLFCI